LGLKSLFGSFLRFRRARGTANRPNFSTPPLFLDPGGEHGEKNYGSIAPVAAAAAQSVVPMRVQHGYPIGTPGVPWDDDDRRLWLESRRRHPDRDYDSTVLPSHASSSPSSPEEGGGGGAGGVIDGFRPIVYGKLERGAGRPGEYYPLLAFVSDAFSYPPSRGRGGAVEDGDDDDRTKTIDDQGDDAPPSPLRSRSPDDRRRPAVLITGGVHGYETSGISGAMSFLRSGLALRYSELGFDVAVVPCVSPWGYEHDERWTRDAVDPNRSFGPASISCPDPVRTEESRQLLAFLDGLRTGGEDGVVSEGRPRWLCHLDLHETTDSDVSEFRPARSARDGLAEYDDHIPDGFYLFGASSSGGGEDEKELLGLHRAILAGVEKVTHIAESDADGMLCGHPATARGLLLLPRDECEAWGICGGGAVPCAPYAITTEMYPDSDRTAAAAGGGGEDRCSAAQVEAIRAALDFLLLRNMTGGEGCDPPGAS